MEPAVRIERSRRPSAHTVHVIATRKPDSSGACKHPYRYSVGAYDRYRNWLRSAVPAAFTVREDANLLANGDFETGANAAATFWIPESWLSTAAFGWAPAIGVDSTHAVTIDSASPNDAAISQVVVVIPRQAYTVTGWIKGDKRERGRTRRKRRRDSQPHGNVDA